MCTQEPRYQDFHEVFDIHDLIVDFATRREEIAPLLSRFELVVPRARGVFDTPWFVGSGADRVPDRVIRRETTVLDAVPMTAECVEQRRALMHMALDERQFLFPDRRLIQYVVLCPH